jgi:spectinomycin phosphotransferase
MLAPKERDLMFVVGGGISRKLVGPADEELFLQGYGSTSIDALGLTYYRYAWAVSDIGAYAAEVLFRPDLGEITRQAAVELFMSLFQPGNIVALALGSDYR